MFQALDGDFYERLRNHFRVFSTTEIESSTFVKSCFQIISDEADMVIIQHLKEFDTDDDSDDDVEEEEFYDDSDEE